MDRSGNKNTLFYQLARFSFPFPHLRCSIMQRIFIFMTRFTVFILPFALFVSSCQTWLDPLYIESDLNREKVPVLKTLPDGRDISGYPIPGTKVNAGAKNNNVDEYSSSSKEEIPEGLTTGKVNQVRSPFAPYKVLDSSGYKSGDLVKDPSSLKVFRLP